MSKSKGSEIQKRKSHRENGKFWNKHSIIASKGMQAELRKMHSVENSVHHVAASETSTQSLLEALLKQALNLC